MIELAFRIISNVFCWWGSVEPLIKNMPPIDNQWMVLKAKASWSEGVVSRFWTDSWISLSLGLKRLAIRRRWEYCW